MIDDRCDDKRLAGGRDAAPATDKPAFPDAEGGKICRYPSGIDGLPWACAVLSRSGETTGHICEHVLESIGHFSFIVLPNGFIGDGASGLRESAFRGGAALLVTAGFGLTSLLAYIKVGGRAHSLLPFAICASLVLARVARELMTLERTGVALAATALMSEDEHPATPASLTLMAGPIDCRISPTEVNKLATTQPIEWFESKLISRVPWRFRGAGRRVYPGFVQLTAFMSMNKERHLNAFRDYYVNLVEQDDEKVQATRAFYEEYMAVADLSADFYLETVSLVFQQYALPQGKLTVRGRRIDPAAIRRTALVTIEGERDDICSIGQTLAAQDLCTSVRAYRRVHHMQAGVGHYGVFSGKKWEGQIYPLVRNAILSSE